MIPLLGIFVKWYVSLFLSPEALGMVLCVFLTVPPSLYPAFQSSLSSKKSTTQRCWTFWQGHKDLNPEPTVLETRLINQPLGGLLLKRIFQQSKSKSPPYSQKPIKNETNWEFQQQAYGLLGLRSILPKPSAQKLYHIPLILSRIRGLFLASFGSNRSQSL